VEAYRVLFINTIITVIESKKLRESHAVFWTDEKCAYDIKIGINLREVGRSRLRWNKNSKIFYF
jgi:hypothetical protein